MFLVGVLVSEVRMSQGIAGEARGRLLPVRNARLRRPTNVVVKDAKSQLTMLERRWSRCVRVGM